METKLCRECGPLPMDRFYPSSRTLLCKACQNKERGKYRRSNPVQAQAAARRARLKRYGLTPEDYDRMVTEQDSRCAICLKPGETDPSSLMRLGVDHDHVTGRVRGLLCRPCNRAVGIIGDDPELARRMAAYLTL